MGLQGIGWRERVLAMTAKWKRFSSYFCSELHICRKEAANVAEIAYVTMAWQLHYAGPSLGPGPRST
jgi:hypothetical protein